MVKFYCPAAKDESVEAGTKVEAWKALRCGDCGSRKTCNGPLVKNAKEAASAQATNNDDACRAALLELIAQPSRNQLAQKEAEEFIKKFRKELLDARAKHIGWKTICKAIKKYGYSFGWNSLEKAFKRLEAKGG